ncbi:hypothetical protein HB852_01475 [Listeria grandensis]|uniref:MucBP domain-containing protein n=1 Tax=Listeria grandensis TaxID=1494963 RepID=UPI00162583DD|nr:MucBP domain-containing protein [Listeria grandensis]MBC1473288.1 hypothetical protein [Listeria grandensis]
MIIYEAAEAKSITIHYVDEFGDNIISPKEVHGEYGETYDIQVQKIEGYQIWKAPVSMTRTFSEEKQIVTLQYATHVVPPNSTYRSLFKDVCFGAAVMAAAGDALLDGEVTQEKLDQIVKISLVTDNSCSSLEGAQYLHNLKELFITSETSYLDNGDIQNLDGLSRSADLVRLYLPDQDIVDISGLENLSKLAYLNLNYNKIQDASPIANLSQLEYVNLGAGNKIQSLEPFLQLTNLKELYLSANVSDFRPLQHLPLIQDPNARWTLLGDITLPDAYVGEPVFMQAFDPFGNAPTFGIVELEGDLGGGKYTSPYMDWKEVGNRGTVTFTQRPAGATNSSRYMNVVFRQRVLPAKATVQPVTVRYVDDQGEVLAPEERLTGVLGEAYTAQAKTIDGYKLTKEPANRVGTFSTEAQTVTFVYTKEAATLIPANSTYRSLFPDTKLAITVAKQIYPVVYFEDLDLDQEVTQEELNRVTEINENWDITENPMRNIEGVQYLHNLKRLSIGDGSGWSGFVENLDRLAGLDKLERLSIVNNKVQDISGIKNLTNLRYLDLSDNKIIDASPIAGLTKLESIDFARGNRIQSLAPFRQLTHLKKLFLSSSVSDFRPLQHLPLIQDPNATWALVGNITLPDAYVGEPVFMQAFDPTGEQVMFGGVMVDGKWEGMKAYDGKYATYSKAGMGNVTFTQSLSEPSATDRYIRVDFKQRVLPAKAIVQPVTVRYVDDQGEALAPEDSLAGVLGEAYEAQAKTIDGYQLTKEPANRVGSFSTEAQTVTFVYAQETAPPMSQPVTVQYVDDQGKALTQEETLTGAFGAPYQAEAKTIPGYQLTSLPSNHTGTFQAVAQTVRFVYTKQSLPVVQPVTMQHVDAQGKAIAEEDVLHGHAGEAYHAKAKAIPGYHVSQHPANATGIFGPSAQTVRFVYAPDEPIEAIDPVEEGHTTPPKPSLPSPVIEDIRTPSVPLPTQVSSEASPSVVPVVPGPTLPSLGDRTTHSIGWGLTLLLVGTWLFLRPRYQASKRKGAKFK